MGNCCGKPSSSNFQGEGRTLGSAPAHNPPTQPQPTSAALPSNITQASVAKEESGPLSAAGKAAQERMAKASTTSGKLSQQLAEQKKQSRIDTLKAASEDERLLRDAQSNAEARNWN